MHATRQLVFPFGPIDVTGTFQVKSEAISNAGRADGREFWCSILADWRDAPSSPARRADGRGSNAFQLNGWRDAPSSPARRTIMRAKSKLPQHRRAARHHTLRDAPMAEDLHQN
ncbi:hypothetical protein A2U01_0056808, partial [Trifolium medium]|nr:hypothetical protein [Trifolium medium]